jgi:hypothetical protein
MVFVNVCPSRKEGKPEAGLPWSVAVAVTPHRIAAG